MAPACHYLILGVPTSCKAAREASEPQLHRRVLAASASEDLLFLAIGPSCTKTLSMNWGSCVASNCLYNAYIVLIYPRMPSS